MEASKVITVALILALSSNAILMFMLLWISSNGSLFNDTGFKTLEQPANVGPSGPHDHASGFIQNKWNIFGAALHTDLEDTPWDKKDVVISRNFYKDLSSNNDLVAYLKVGKPRKFTTLKRFDAFNNLYTADDGRNFHTFLDKINLRDLDVPSEGKKLAQESIFKDNLSSHPKHLDKLGATFFTNTRTNILRNTNWNNRNFGANLNELPGYQTTTPPQDKRRDTSTVKRVRRDTMTTPKGIPSVDRSGGHRIHEVFSTFSDSELAKFDPAVYDLLIPALVHFETLIIREFESFRSFILSHDLRLENLERFMLSIVSEKDQELQSDTTDNKSQPDGPSHVLEKKANNENSSKTTKFLLEIDGSGDGEWEHSQTTTSPKPTSLQNVAFYDLYRILSSVEQKIMALENYNVMSDSELTRVRSEVVKMDDKVTELDRRQRNLQTYTLLHTQKITDFEVYISKTELGIHTALDSYGRVNSRLEAFKDKLAEFKNDLQIVAAQFGRHDQITNELRTADSYKAHDIQEIRKSVFGIEGRLNGLYRVLDHNLDTVRSDLRVMLDRLCANNKLAC